MLNRPLRDGIGYTGHVEDADTGLVYAQQRYLDPSLPVWLSADPVTAYGNPVGSFNRYNYAGNNPYTMVDPDGRAPGCGTRIPGMQAENCTSYVPGEGGIYLNSGNLSKGGGQKNSSSTANSVQQSGRPRPTIQQKIGRNLGRLGDSIKVEGSVGLKLGIKAKVGPVKASLEAGSASPFGVGFTLVDGYTFTEVRGPSAALEVGNYAAGYVGSSQKSLLGRHGQFYSEENSSGGLVLGRKDWEANMGDGEVGVTAGAFLVEVSASIDVGKAAIALFYWGDSEEEP